ncbi:N-formylglutamate amidohydrolase [Nitratireductor luteus]|uniref:N-formylglutamate amidohydrolase n=1 Tax=Nitratireductor luteus TaxID=2976980 RepID=UPI00223EDDA5
MKPLVKQDETEASGSVVETINAEGSAGFVLACEHASRAIPPEYGDLGLGEEALSSHIAWDPGARAVAVELARLLDAPLVAQRVSRLVYDCNRPMEAPDAMPVRSELYMVPGNMGLTEEERAARVAQFYRPFEKALAASLDSRTTARRLPMLVTIHSFTPVYNGVHRDVEIGVLHDRDSRLADALLASLMTGAGFEVRRNEPYGPEHGVMHTLVTHALPRGLHNVMIEVRNDLIADEVQQARLARLLAEHLTLAKASVERSLGV